MLVSNRGIQLVTQTHDKRMLTVEDYCKWYDLFLIEPAGQFKQLNGINISIRDGETIVLYRNRLKIWQRIWVLFTMKLRGKRFVICTKRTVYKGVWL